jgi:hypothetical protein
VRRLLILVLFALVLAGGAAVTWKAMGQARLVAQDLTTARALLTRAGGFESGKLKARLALIDQAQQHLLAAEQRLNRWPLRQLGVLPLVGRDIRVAKAVATSATGTTKATRGVVSALQPLQAKAPTGASIQKASGALLALHGSLEQDLERVRAARPLVTAGTRDRYLEAANSASASANRAGQGLKLAGTLYGPPGTARWFLAFQNPAELRGTGGLIGEYGILESSPSGPKLVKVEHYTGRNDRTDEGVPLPKEIAARYERYAIVRDWTAQAQVRGAPPERDPQRRAAAGAGRPGRGHGPGRPAARAGRRPVPARGVPAPSAAGRDHGPCPRWWSGRRPRRAGLGRPHRRAAVRGQRRWTGPTRTASTRGRAGRRRPGSGAGARSAGRSAAEPAARAAGTGPRRRRSPPRRCRRRWPGSRRRRSTSG